MMWLQNSSELIDELSARFELRRANKAALTATIDAIQQGDGREVVCDLATGVGKTFIMASLVDYLAEQGVRNILVVTPGSTIQTKTLGNFSPGNPKFVEGANWQPVLITAENFSRGSVGEALHDDQTLKLFVFNVQQLIRPTAKVSRRTRRIDEFIGTGLYQHLQEADDLVVIADEHHVYRSSAKAFSAAIRDLRPRALVGLTATPDPADQDKVIFHYSLAEAIADELVKIPVIVYRQDGQKSEEVQLADACHLREVKERAWLAWAASHQRETVHPVLFVVCQNISDAERVAELLAGESYLPGEGRVLLVTSQSSDVALRELQSIEAADSPVRAVVSVNRLKEGWDVKNIGVIVGLRSLASQTLTEQVLGRGLRLPFGKRTGNRTVDTVELIAHDSYRELLANKEVLLQQILARQSPVEPMDKVDGELETGKRPKPEIDVDDSVDQMTFRFPVADGESNEWNQADLLIVEEYSAAQGSSEYDARIASSVLNKVDGAPDILFPRRELELLPERFSLSLVRDSDARRTGEAYRGEVEVDLRRYALDVRRDVNEQLVITQEMLESEQATQRSVDIETVRSDLEERIISLPIIESSLTELNASRRVVRAFLQGAGVVEGQQVRWSEVRARFAVRAMARLVQQAYEFRRSEPVYSFNTVKIPVVPRPMPSPVEDRWTSKKFSKSYWYKGWQHSIEPVVSFDAKSTEFALAEMFDSNLAIEWWLRNYEPGEAWIDIDGTSKYYPDFLVLDSEGIYWVVEGKADDRMDDGKVIKKANAANDWSRRVRDEAIYGVWRYLLASETAIKQAQGSWSMLKAIAQPEL